MNNRQRYKAFISYSHHGESVRCGYVGRTQGHKGFPATPIFSLTRAP